VLGVKQYVEQGKQSAEREELGKHRASYYSMMAYCRQPALRVRFSASQFHALTQQLSHSKAHAFQKDT